MLGGITITLLFGMPPVPAPAALINAMQRVEIETSTELASTFRMRFGIAQSPGTDWDLIGQQYQDTLFRPFTPVQVRVKVGIEFPQAIINGYIAGQQVLYDDIGGNSAIEVIGMDATMLMNLQEKVAAWPMTDSDIAAQIFARYGITPMVSPTLASISENEGTTTQRGTDIRFLRRLAQRNGYECFVLPDPRTGTELGYFAPATNDGGFPDAVLNVRMGPQTNVSEFKVRYDMTRPTAAPSPWGSMRKRDALSGPALDATPPPLANLYPTGLPMGLEDAVRRSFGPRSQPLILPAETASSRRPGLATATQAIANRSSSWP